MGTESRRAPQPGVYGLKWFIYSFWLTSLSCLTCILSFFHVDWCVSDSVQMSPYFIFVSSACKPGCLACPFRSWQSQLCRRGIFPLTCALRIPDSIHLCPCFLLILHDTKPIDITVSNTCKMFPIEVAAQNSLSILGQHKQAERETVEMLLSP